MTPIAQIRHEAFQRPVVRLMRYQYIADVFAPQSTTSTGRKAEIRIMESIIATVKALPKSLSVGDAISQRIIAAYAEVTAKIETSTSKNSTKQESNSFIENCDICGSVIPFAEFIEAACPSGHRFGECLTWERPTSSRVGLIIIVRCGLTFLTIQAPGISKFCGICGRQFLNDNYLEKSTLRTNDNGIEDLSAQSKNEIETGENAAFQSLAQVLFAACDVCIYCGGKFVG